MFSLKAMSPSITDMIRFDHSHVVLTYHQYVAGKPSHVKKALAETICAALDIHATLEEEFFYPALRAQEGADPALQNSVPEHNAMRAIMADLRAALDDDVRRDQLLAQLMREVLHHVADEETVLLPQAERLFSKERLNELGAEMTKRRMQLLAPQAGRIAANTAVGFSRSAPAIAAGAVGVFMALRMLARRRHAHA